MISLVIFCAILFLCFASRPLSSSWIKPQFRVTQHMRDLEVLKRIIESMGCGTIVNPSEGRDRYSISVANISDLVNIVLPF